MECDGEGSEAGRSKIDAQGLPHRAQARMSTRSMSTKHWQTHGANAPQSCSSHHWLLGIPARTSSRPRLTSPLLAPSATPISSARAWDCTVPFFFIPATHLNALEPSHEQRRDVEWVRVHGRDSTLLPALPIWEMLARW